MKLTTEVGSWCHDGGRNSFQLGIGFYYDPYFPAFKVRLGLGFWFAGLMLMSHRKFKPAE